MSRSITQILAGLKCFMRSVDHHIRVCDPANKELHQALDHHFRDLHSKGIDAIRQQCEVISLYL